MGANVEKELKHAEKEFSHEYNKILKNPWAVTAIILVAILLVGGILVYTGKLGGASASTADVEKNVLNFATSRGVEATVKSITSVDSFYEVILDIQGQETPLYVTKDGKYLVPQYLPLVETETPTTTPEAPKDIPKTDKPTIELYVFSYCPYGLQMEKAFAPVVTLLGSKIDYKIRQIGAMHGDYEKVEAERQLCIEKEYPAKFLAYVKAFAEDSAIGACSGDATCLTPKLNALMTKLGITSTKIDSCMKTNGEALYNAELQNSEAKGVGGSPTVLINGVDAQLSRSPDAIKTAICAAFTTQPSECSQSLSTTQASPGFGASAGSAASSSASC
jgi:hypothetical protein